ncbi:MAG TPA: hypothetical protein VII63_08515 [Caulobacteraceae bacterium]
MAKRDQVRAVAFKEGDVWVVHGVEYDVVAQTADIFDAPRAFLKTLRSTMLINQKLGRPPLSCLKAAPEKYREMFDGAEMELHPVHPPFPKEAGIPRPDIRLRGVREFQAA